MIFVWLAALARYITQLFKLPPAGALARIDPNAHCPVCGASAGSIRCVYQRKPGPKVPDQLTGKDLVVLCMHTCGICGGRWFESPISSKANVETIFPGVPRTDIEAKEDRLHTLVQ